MPSLNRDSVVHALLALGLALLPLAVEQGWLNSSDAAAIGGLLGTFTAGYHANNAKAASALQLTRPVVVDGPAEPTPVNAAQVGKGEPVEPGDVHWIDQPDTTPATPEAGA